MKKITACFLAITLIFAAMCTAASAAIIKKDGLSVTIHNASPWYITDGEWKQGKYPAEYKDGVMYMSLDDFGVVFRCYVNHDTRDNSVYVNFGDRSIWQGIGYRNLFVGGVAYDNPAPYIAANGAVMVPAEPYASVIGYTGGYYEVKPDYAPGQTTLYMPEVNYTVTSLEVNQAAQLITVYGKSPWGTVEPVKYMLCSTGVNGSTPCGSFKVTPIGGKWYYFSRYNCYVLYASSIAGDVCFHSIPLNGNYYASLSRTGYKVIGQPASHGCIRLFAEDSKFIHQNCAGLPVNVIWGYTNEKTTAIRNSLIASKPSYEAYVEKLKSENY